MSTFWQLLKESVIIQGTITVLIVGAIVYLAIAQIVIPDILGQMGFLIVGFYFGSKSGIAIQTSVKDTIEALGVMLKGKG